MLLNVVLRQDIQSRDNCRPKLREESHLGPGTLHIHRYSEYLASSLKQLNHPAVIDRMYRVHGRCFQLSVFHHVLLDPSQLQHRAHKNSHLLLVICYSYRQIFLNIPYQAEIALPWMVCATQ